MIYLKFVINIDVIEILLVNKMIEFLTFYPIIQIRKNSAGCLNQPLRTTCRF